MSESTVYLVTGANRGIGLALVAHLLARPHTTVLATSRHPSPSLNPSTLQEKGTTIHPTSRLLPVLLDEAQPGLTSATLAARLREEHGVDRLDVVVANAGAASAVKGVLETDPETEMAWDFEVNALGPARLFRGVWGLLERKDGGEEEEDGGLGRFVLVSSSVGSIATLEEESLPGVGYGMSKAAANWWAKKVSVELKGRIVVGILHPGWVQTELGQGLADAIGFKQPPLTAEQSVKGVVEQIDGLTPEKSGKFLTYTGAELPW